MKSKVLLMAIVLEVALAVAFWTAAFAGPDTHLQIQNQSVNRTRPGVAEECVYFDPGTLHVGYFMERGSIELIAAPLRTVSRFESKDDAVRSLKIIKELGINELCRSANAKFSYMLASGKAPKGKLPGEKHVTFDPAQVKSSRVGNEWRLVHGKTVLFTFGADEAAAGEALRVIRYYGFNAKCSVGGDKGFVFLYTTPQTFEIRKKPYLEAKATPAP